jgi:hypothetical protein
LRKIRDNGIPQGRSFGIRTYTYSDGLIDPGHFIH